MALKSQSIEQRPGPMFPDRYSVRDDLLSKTPCHKVACD